MIRVLFFASVREALGVDGIEVPHPGTPLDAAALRALLADRGGTWSRVLGDEARLLVAVNQQMVSPQATVDDGDEVAFFPPVTGG